MAREPSSLIDSVKASTIFTSVILHHDANKPSKNTSKEGDNNREHNACIENCADIFLDETANENSKLILITGDRAIGKTLFSKKYLQEWTEQEPSVEDDTKRFACFIPVIDLNLLDDKALTLVDLVSYFLVLNQHMGASLHEDALVRPLVHNIIDNPKQLCLLFDDLTDYNHLQQISSDKENQFPDDPNVPIPLPILIGKLLKRKLLKGCLVTVTTQSSEKYQTEKFNFDRHVEITTLSEVQVFEQVKRFFGDKPDLRGKVLKNVKTSEHFVHFGKAPILCFLMCTYLEKELTEKDYIQFPQSLTDVYSTVTNYIETHHNQLIFPGNQEIKENDVEKCLERLSEFAAQMAVNQKYTFNEVDIKNVKLSDEEASSLQSSNLLCRSFHFKSPLCNEIVVEYSFCHPSLQDYFAACAFVSKNVTPGRKLGIFSRRKDAPVSEMVMQFMSGLLDSKKDEKLMVKLLKYIDNLAVKHQFEYHPRILAIRCLYEYGDADFMRSVVKKNRHQRYWDKDGVIRINHYNDIDSKPLSKMVDVFCNLACSNLITTPIPSTLYIVNSSKSSYHDLHYILNSLSQDSSPITKLWLESFNLQDDNYVEVLSKCLSSTNITDFTVCSCRITNTGATTLVSHCDKITSLSLTFNDITDVRELCKCPTFYKLRELDLSYNPLSDDGIETFPEHCHNLDKLNLSYNWKLSNECKKEIRGICKEKYPELHLEI